ncbi:MAG: polysaccharide pyruvyl transferase family protein [Phycisphaerales bacterium JB038]
MALPRCHFLFNGLGAGNIGDEAMFAGFNRLFRMAPGSTVEVYDERAPILRTLPDAFEYLTWTDPSRTDDAIRAAEVVLLVGDTLVSELHGVAWPLLPIGERVGRAIELGKTVHGVAIGVDRLTTADSRAVFAEYHAHLATWTTRSEACRAALIDLGVAPDRITAAADLAWLCPTGVECPDPRAAALGEEPIVAVNIVGEDWAADDARTLALARALDRAAEELKLRLAFVCNETRRHPVYDYDTACRLADHMRSQPILVDPSYVTPGQQISLLRRCRAVVSQRYHLGLMGVLAQRPVGLFDRGQKLVQLAAEISAPSLGPHDVIDEERVLTALEELLSDGAEIVARQQAARERLTKRLCDNAGRFLRRPG